MLTKIANLMRLNEATWERHANPWSVWTRILGLFLLVFSIWSRVWIEYYSILPIALSVLWIWLNPRFFKVPASTKNWASYCVLGERVYLELKETEISRRHKILPNILIVVNSIGFIILTVSLIQINQHLLVIGLILQLSAKLWYLDRMVWLYHEYKYSNPRYISWEY